MFRQQLKTWLIIKISGKELNVKFEDPRIGDIAESYPNITKARKILMYEPKYLVEDGLRLYE